MVNLNLCLSLAAMTLPFTPPPAQAAPLSASAAPHKFEIAADTFLLDGKPLVIRCGEIHFPRVPREYWEHRLKMCKAMGLNTVCVYLFWNYHEWEEGKFNWSGQADVAEFCRLAQREGLWVLLRPGPYSCAEWEMGGLPWWLLKKETKLRTGDPSFLVPATRYLKEVARVLGPLQVTKGGPILMAQVENEYGSFGSDANYTGALRQAMIDGGFNIPLFACNPPGAIRNGYRSDLFQVVNFGANGAPKSFETLRQFQKTGPLMNGEYYPAWFDVWGRKHATKPFSEISGDLEFMLKNKYSFSIYMAHGGTSFGFWSGADRPFQPDTSSYDYDAPISEAGWATSKFTALRELMGKYLLPGETLPEPPKANPVIEIPPVAMTQVAPVFANLPKPLSAAVPPTMEAINQSRGCMVYRIKLPAGPAGTLKANQVRDFAWVYLNGAKVGVMDRRRQQYEVALPERKAPAQLDILLEAVGRVNFGKEVFDRKGLYAPVQFVANDGKSQMELKGWEVYSLPLDSIELGALKFAPAAANPRLAKSAAFWRGGFNLAKTGDTFLDMRSWGKGVAWVNGHCLGRFWSIGPTQTMYLPGPWLKPGFNEVIFLDLVGPREAKIAGLAQPILGDLHPELDLTRTVRAMGQFNPTGMTPALEGSFTPAIQWQESKFAQPAKGRYLCLEALSVHDKGSAAAIAELDALDAKGEVMSKANWKILWVDSEAISDQGDAENILDGQPNSRWLTEANTSGLPHRLVIDLGQNQTVAGIRYMPAAGRADAPGRIKNFRVYLGDQPFGLSLPK
jgi:beta-galactosidase